MNIKVNYHNSILIDNRIYVDPLKVNGKVKAEYIFITHPHWDHFSVDDITKILSSDTKVICPKTMKKDIENIFNNQIMFVEPEQTYNIDDIKFSTIYSYNIDKQFHPKQNLWVGYILEIGDDRVAIVGDSDNTAELQKVKTDILLIPIGGHYTMNATEAAEATNIINPKKVIPTHYGEIVGNKTIRNDFKRLLNSNIDCELQI